MTIKDILTRPTIHDKVHESIYRSYHLLAHVLTMIERGDSKETIFEVVELISKAPEPTPEKET